MYSALIELLVVCGVAVFISILIYRMIKAKIKPSQISFVAGLLLFLGFSAAFYIEFSELPLAIIFGGLLSIFFGAAIYFGLKLGSKLSLWITKNKRV